MLVTKLVGGLWVADEDDARRPLVKLGVVQGLTYAFGPFVGVIDLDGVLRIQAVGPGSVFIPQLNRIETGAESVCVLLFGMREGYGRKQQQSEQNG